MAGFTVSSSLSWTTILAFSLAFVFHTSSPPSLAEATNSGGFSLELIHRDSPKSPLYNSSETHSERVTKSLLRSLRRVERLSAEIGDYENPRTTLGYDSSGEYLVKVGFGTPIVETHLIVDTGSNLIWTQCKGCTNCIRLNTPAYDPSASSTYVLVACVSHSCNSLLHTCFGDQGENCRYSLWYEDGWTQTFGDLSQDTFTLTTDDGESLSFPNVVFGCGHDNQAFFDGNISGVLGMGSGFNGLPRQLRYMTGPKFSYCFAPSYDVPGRLSFGNVSLITGANVVSTPLIWSESDNFFRITLKAISVGTTRVEFGSSSKVGNMVVDSGTVQTFLPVGVYNRLESEVRNMINATELDPPFGEKFTRLCYPSTAHIPDVFLTMHLDGADLPLQLSDMFIKYSTDLRCFTFGPSSNDNLFIYGNWAQSNFWVGFDVDAKTVSFKPSACTTP